MSDPHEIWQLGRWIGGQEGGAARLAWTDGELILRIHKGRVRFVEGIDSTELGKRLSCQPGGNHDLLEEARSLAKDGQIAETHAMGAAKELIQGSLRAWLLDPTRELEIVEGEPDDVDGATISITHTLVELVLSDTSGEIADAILPNDDVLLVRSPGFLDLYAPLRLSEEADLIVSKISGERTAGEVAENSNHGSDEVLRLLAGLVVTGIFEPETPLHISDDVDLLPAEEITDGSKRRIPVSWILGTAAALFVVLAVILFIMTRSSDSEPIQGVTGENDLTWSLVIDLGCEPQDLQRVLKKAQENPKVVRPVAADVGDFEPCWRLVWGRFSSREAAEAATDGIPAELLQQGFEPHPIELTGEELEPPTSAGG
ncbi:MAG: hypothetical protein OEV48_00120 [Acidobacteriota bacterium]|nr:hypothetical protein [Acidobacteriota bacterium]